jgi:two-component system, chemotaxis family, sensor kinase Cph1
MLNPRASFELWREAVHGRSRPWTKAEIDVVQRFRDELITISQHRRVKELNSMLQQKIGEADRLIAQKDLLMREAHHRVQNSLQLVSAMLRLQQREFSDPTVQARFEETQQRILAAAAVHRHLWKSDEIGTVRLDNYLQEIRAMGQIRSASRDVDINSNGQSSRPRLDRDRATHQCCQTCVWRGTRTHPGPIW